MGKKTIHSDKAPKAIGTYSQAVQSHNTVYLSGQIPLNPKTMELVGSDPEQQIRQVFNNLQAVCSAAGGSLADIVKLNVYLVDLTQFPLINRVMEELFSQPFPARAAIGVAALPKNAGVEMDAIMVISG